jgi:hypothetical protein
MTPAGAALAGGLLEVFQHWIGWGWGLTGVVYLAGIIFILKVVSRLFQSKLPTAAMVVVWTVAVLLTATRLFGITPPSGP